jgi:signal transduction histidine kinase
MRTQELNIKNTQLQELNSVKDKLFSIISHDLKTPMASLSVLLEVFLNLKDSVSLDKIEKYGQKVQSYIRDVTDLLDNLLQWSLTQIGHKKVSLTELDLREILKKNIELLELVAQQKEVKVIKEWGPDEVYVKADEEMLNLVIRNLLNNAIK